MPIFDYVCPKCNEKQEVIQKFIDTQERKCPKCDTLMEKAIGLSSFRLKGSGWYKTTSTTD